MKKRSSAQAQADTAPPATFSGSLANRIIAFFYNLFLPVLLQLLKEDESEFFIRKPCYTILDFQIGILNFYFCIFALWC